MAYLGGLCLLLLNKFDLSLQVRRINDLDVYCFFSYCGREWLTVNNTVFPPEHRAGSHYPASLAVRCDHVTETDQWGVGERDGFLPILLLTLSPFLPLPADAEYPGERFRICILTRPPGDTYAY